MSSRLALLLVFAACGPDTDSISIDLAPDVISSLDGSLAVHATAFAAREPAEGESIQIVADYTDRNGIAHAIEPAEGTSSATGGFDAVLTGFTFDGTGTVTARIMSGSEPLLVGGEPVEASAHFAVLDRTPPTVTITPPPGSTIQRGNDVQVEVHVTDEIGISQVFFESDQGGGNNRDRGTVVASGATDTTVTFEFQVGDNIADGATITLYALAADLSGNQAAALPITVTVVAP
jgi:hypothetical protein